MYYRQLELQEQFHILYVNLKDGKMIKWIGARLAVSKIDRQKGKQLMDKK